MFNALRSDELLVGVGRMLRMAADLQGPPEDYERSVLLSAFSVTRLLASEQRAAPALLASTQAGLDDVLAADLRPAVSEARRRIAAAADGVEVGDVLVDLLAELPAQDPTRTAVHGVLRRMVDEEVAALARSPEEDEA
ncbi:hypothetical protein FSW04_11450 [Baekduia soli]|uniref:Uncharacterized protein n=1 Tax=Baekduia soli TaxID=496014 RepID=A0A5B8U643_9ACTN|nr:hypothetical protein [Baekduia soli]QEC48122.1 hypothetical protein FSW04_11450 [Baekduia soli]